MDPTTSRRTRAATSTGGSTSAARHRAPVHGGRRGAPAPARATSSSSTRTTSRSTSSSPTRSSALRFEHPEVQVRRGRRPGRDRVFCSGANIYMLGVVDALVQGELLQVHERDAALPRGRVRALGPRVARRVQRARPPAAATSSRSRATRSCSSTTATRRSASPRRRSSPCCPAPAASRASSTSARCAAIAPTCSARLAEGIKGKRAKDWGLVDHLVSRTKWDETRRERAQGARREQPSPRGPRRRRSRRSSRRSRRQRSATVTSTLDDRRGAHRDARPCAAHEARTDGRRRDRRAAPSSWALRAFRELDDALLRLRFDHAEIGLVTVRDARRRRAACSRTTRRSRTTRDTGFAREVPSSSGARAEALRQHRAQPLRGRSIPSSCFAGCAARARARRRSLLHARRRRREGRACSASRDRRAARCRCRTACRASRALGIDARSSPACAQPALDPSRGRRSSAS